MNEKLAADSVTELLALVGANIAPARARNIAEALERHVAATRTEFAALPFEVEPAGYLHASAEAAP